MNVGVFIKKCLYFGWKQQTFLDEWECCVEVKGYLLVCNHYWRVLEMNRVASSLMSNLLKAGLKVSLLAVPCLLMSHLFVSEAQAVSIELDGTRTILSGTDCDLATYRYGTNTSFDGTPLDLIVEVTGEDNQHPTDDCVGIGVSGGRNLLEVRINDEDGGVGDTAASMDLKITVVEENTLTPIEVDRMLITAFDLDINNSTNPNFDLQTETDDVYLRFPESSYRSRASQVSYAEGSFFGGLYQVQLGGSTLGNCDDNAAVIDETCRASSIYINGLNGFNTVSTINIRVQNDDAYGNFNGLLTFADGSTFDASASHRLFQLSFEISDLIPVVEDNEDLGDAPTSYGVAGNSIEADLALGFGIVADDDNLAIIDKSSPNADGDDADAEIFEYDDEDAVALNGQPLDNQFLAADSTVNMDVTTFGSGFLNAWVDLDASGDFGGAAEQVVTDLAIGNASVVTTSVPITIPAGAVGGDSFIRFRLSRVAGEGPTGVNATDGEVEDYKITLTSSAADVLLVKRITAVNGQSLNPNDGTSLNVVVDDTVSIYAADDNDPGWPVGYLIGEIDAGLVKPGDELEYTVYFLNAGNLLADDVRICDRLYPDQSLVNDGYGVGIAAQVQIGTGSAVNLTATNDSVDRTEFISASSPVPATCNLQGVNDNGTLIVDVTGPVGSGSPNLTQLEATTGAGVPNESYGLFRFRTRVSP